jgi:hypothetical protein
MADRQTRQLDRGLHCAQLSWLLLCAESALGERGTMGGVVSAIERGGGSTYSDASPFHDAMLARIGWAQGEGSRQLGHRNVDRAKRLWTRWCQVADQHQRILLAAYLGHQRAPDRVQLRFGELAGVVAIQWVDRARSKRRPDRLATKSTLEDALCQVLIELEPIEATMTRPIAPGPGQRQRRFRHLSAVRLLTPLARPLQQARDGLLARLATADQDVSLDDDLAALRAACEGKEPPGLQARADRAVREAHQAWQDTSTRERVQADEEAKAWAEGA